MDTEAYLVTVHGVAESDMTEQLTLSLHAKHLRRVVPLHVKKLFMLYQKLFKLSKLYLIR